MPAADDVPHVPGAQALELGPELGALRPAAEAGVPREGVGRLRVHVRVGLAVREAEGRRDREAQPPAALRARRVRGQEPLQQRDGLAPPAAAPAAEEGLQPVVFVKGMFRSP